MSVEENPSGSTAPTNTPTGVGAARTVGASGTAGAPGAASTMGTPGAADALGAGGTPGAADAHGAGGALGVGGTHAAGGTHGTGGLARAATTAGAACPPGVAIVAGASGRSRQVKQAGVGGRPSVGTIAAVAGATGKTGTGSAQTPGKPGLAGVHGAADGDGAGGTHGTADGDGAGCAHDADGHFSGATADGAAASIEPLKAVEASDPMSTAASTRAAAHRIPATQSLDTAPATTYGMPPELARLGADKFCSEVIRNMRSSGRMLLSSPVVFPAFERVSIVLSTSAHPTKLVILDCGEGDRPVADRRAYAKALVRRMLPDGSKGRALARRAVARQPLPASGSQRAAANGSSLDGSNSRATEEHLDPSQVERRDHRRGVDEMDLDGGSSDGRGGASDGDSAADGGSSCADGSSRWDTGLAEVASSPALAESLNNSGRAVSDPKRKQETVTSSMVARFLSGTGLRDLEMLTFAMSVDLWTLAKALKDELAVRTGVWRTWSKLCPRQLFEANWSLDWSTADIGNVADRTCLFPPRDPRIKCSLESRAVALVVAFALSPFWNLAVRLFFAEHPVGAGDEVDQPGGSLDAVGASAPPSDGPKIGERAAEGDADARNDGPGTLTPLVPPRAVDAVLVRGEGPVGSTSPNLPLPLPPAGAARVSARDVLLLGRRRLHPSKDDGDGGASPRKIPRTGAAAVLTSLVGRPLLGAKLTGAPPKRLALPAEPPIPELAQRTGLPSEKFVLRRAVAAARLSTTAQMVERWKRVPSVPPDEGVVVRVVSAREFAKATKEQDNASILLPPETLKQAGERRHALFTAAEDVDKQHQQDRAVLEIIVKGDLLQLPYTVVPLMAELHRANADYTVAVQSSTWLKSIVKKQILVDPASHPFLLPSRLSVLNLVAAVRGTVGRARLSHTVWTRSVPVVLDPMTGEAVDVQSTWCLDVRSFLSAARSAWLKCSFVDALLVELAHFSAAAGRGTHVMTCEKFTSMMRTPQDKTVQLSEATRLGRRWAVGAGRCTSFATMVNHHNAHWCAAFVSLSDREIVFYDPLAPSAQDEESEFSLARLRLLGNCMLSAQRGEASCAAATWTTKFVRSPQQEDSVSCGVFSLQFLVGRVTGSAYDLDGDEPDLLRLVLLHKVLVAGTAGQVAKTTTK